MTAGCFSPWPAGLRPRRTLLRCFALIALAGLLLGASGCDDETLVNPEERALELLRYLPFAVVVPAGEELEYADRYVAAHPGHIALWGVAVHRMPYYGEKGGIVLKETPWEELRSGMTVVYVTSDGLRKGGLLVRPEGRGWIVKDWGYAKNSPEPIIPETLIGVVVTVFVSEEPLTGANAKR
jgi:hypothetical protein